MPERLSQDQYNLVIDAWRLTQSETRVIRSLLLTVAVEVPLTRREIIALKIKNGARKIVHSLLNNNTLPEVYELPTTRTVDKTIGTSRIAAVKLASTTLTVIELINAQNEYLDERPVESILQICQLRSNGPDNSGWHPVWSENLLQPLAFQGRINEMQDLVDNAGLELVRPATEE